jgi:hypothetical protein
MNTRIIGAQFKIDPTAIEAKQAAEKAKKIEEDHIK